MKLRYIAMLSLLLTIIVALLPTHWLNAAIVVLLILALAVAVFLTLAGAVKKNTNHQR